MMAALAPKRETRGRHIGEGIVEDLSRNTDCWIAAVRSGVRAAGGGARASCVCSGAGVGSGGACLCGNPTKIADLLGFIRDVCGIGGWARWARAFGAFGGVERHFSPA